MQLRIFRTANFCLIALVGFNSTNASPTYSQSCFETEKEAKSYQSKFKHRKIDNTEAIKKDQLAQKYAWKENVEFSTLESILGDSQTKNNNTNGLETHEWTIMLTGSPTSSGIRYDAKQGYCLDARMGGTNIITYKWTPEIFDKTRGAVTRYDFYM